MAKWTQEEKNLAFYYLKEVQGYNYVTEKLNEAGYNRSYDSVQKMFKRNSFDEYKEVFSAQKDTQIKKTNNFKVLIFDIETLPIIAYTWKIYKTVLSDQMIIKDWCVLSWSAKWLGEDKVIGEVLTSEEAIDRNDSRILFGVHKLLDEADIIVAHNGKNFDDKKLKARFYLNKMAAPSPYKIVDTLQHSRANFGFTCHKLDYISKLTLRKAKLETNFELWRKCDNGDEEALGYMLEYNGEDVNILEQIYLNMRGWMSGVPNFGTISPLEEAACPHCGSINLEENGYFITSISKFKSFVCLDCDGRSRERKSILSKEQKENLLVPVR